MDITHATFPQELIKIIQHIADSRFIAFDLEFSGVAARRQGGGSGRFTLQEYYHDLRSAAQIYQILQIGLTIVNEDTKKGRYVARPYNFHLSPLPATSENVFRRVWSYNSGAISFLLRHGFNIERPFSQGVHYLSRQEEHEVRDKLIADEKSKANMPNMVLKDEDSVLVDHIRQSISQWQSLPKKTQENYLNIPAADAKDPVPSTLNRYQVRLTHQTVRNEWPKFKTQGMGHFVQITNPTADQQESERALREKMRERDIANAVGFRWVIEAILGGDISSLPHFYVTSGFPEGQAPDNIQAFLDKLQERLRKRKGALVGHNCLTDLINLYRCFIGDLPEKVEDFSARLHSLLPIILDTKYLAGIGSKKWVDTSLQAVENDMSPVALPRIHLPPGYDRYLHAANYHEAGFDSFVTAKIGLKLPGKLKREGKSLPALPQGPIATVEEEGSPELRSNEPDAAVQIEKPDQGLTKGVVDVLKAPLAIASSILTGNDPDKTNDSSAKDSGGAATIVASKATSLPQTRPMSETKKVASASQKSNIFDVLSDLPADTSMDAEEAVAQKDAAAHGRIAEMVEKGELLPGWNDNAEFWRLISNRLQANACEDGILDMLKLQKT
ncbi:uncharacterized protein PV06_08009 [Exophiala oligosperma]|uniref:Uncharacterized protein n=1 Tax=Exophiala oligosperma TaxID=215243 RepID=A0A0D2DCM0_9EURO|nr:uncharacterized protein PV06_08009 [Exophiala oligosperma]KIW40838.1 hypothetical protein PV06_08009 [Exophiala oligosperma]